MTLSFTEGAKKRLEQQQALMGKEEQSNEGGEVVGNKSPSRTKRKSTRKNKIESSSGGESPKVQKKC